MNYTYEDKTKTSKINNIEEFPLVHVPEPGEYLYQSIDNEHMKNIKKDLPTNIHIHIDHMGDADVADVNDKQTIEQLVELFTNIKILQETNEFVTDNYNWVRFEFEDDSEYILNLNLHTYEIHLPSGYKGYSLENFNEFWELCKQLAKPENY